MNAATELATLLSSWTISPGSTAVHARAVEGESDRFWQNQARAVNLMQEVEAQLDALREAGDDVSMFDAQLDRWWEGVFAAKTGWQLADGARRVAVDDASLSLLRAFGLLLSKTGTAGAGSPTRRASLLACVDDAAALLETELADWDKSEKAYLYSLVAAARKALESDSILGERDVESLIHELIGALTAIALDLREAEGADSPRFQKVMNVVGKTGTILRGILQDADAITSIVTAVQAITGGGGH